MTHSSVTGKSNITLMDKPNLLMDNPVLLHLLVIQSSEIDIFVQPQRRKMG